LDQKDPLKICRQQKPEDQDACYISMNTLLLQLNNYNLSEAASYLSTISDDVMASHAMINLAAPISSRDMNKSDHTDAIHTCRSLPSRLRLPCIQGYAFGFLENGQPEREYVKSLGFCESKLLTTEERSSCFEYILSYLPKWYPEEKVVLICQQLAAKERARCEEVIQQ
jgi:hypothetical protein